MLKKMFEALGDLTALFVFAIILTMVFSCGNKNRKEAEKVVTEWIGRDKTSGKFAM
jgi:hypothetical protein